jgi:drug/metabolite transporter (DMT)-like permease
MSPQRLQVEPFPVPDVRIPATGMTTGDWGWLATLTLLWGSGTFFNEVAVRDVAPLTVVFCRVALAAMIVGLVVRRRGVGLLPGRKEVVPFAVLGVVNTVVPYFLIAWGAQRLDSGVAGILLATTPMFTVLIAHVATGDEHLGIATLTGIGLGLTGVLLIVGRAPLAIAGGGVAALALLGAALSYGVACVYGRTLTGIPPLKLAWGHLAVATMLMVPLLVPPGGSGGFHWSWPATGAVAALALLSTAARSLAYFHVLARVGATNTSLVGFLIPASSLALGVLVLGEPLGPGHIAGLGAIVAGLAVVDGRFPTARPPWAGKPARRPRPRKRPLADPRASARYDDASRQVIPW